MTDQADLPQDLLDDPCPTCGCLMSAPQYTRLSSEPDRQETMQRNCRDGNALQADISQAVWNEFLFYIDELSYSDGKGRPPSLKDADELAAIAMRVITLSSPPEPDLLREAVKALEPFAKARPYLFSMKSIEAEVSITFGVGTDPTGSDFIAAQSAHAALTAPLSSPAPAQDEVAAVAWRVKDYADGWIYFDSSRDAHLHAAEAGALLQPLFLHPQQEAAQEETERAARIAEAYPALWEEPDCAAKDIRKLASAEIAEAIRNPARGDHWLKATALHPQQEAQARPAPQVQEIWARALLRSRVERETLERAAQMVLRADEIGAHGYRLESGALKASITAAIRGLAPAPQEAQAQPASFTADGGAEREYKALLDKLAEPEPLPKPAQQGDDDDIRPEVVAEIQVRADAAMAGETWEEITPPQGDAAAVADILHTLALKRIDTLMDAKADTPEGKELSTLAEAVQNYETKRFPSTPQGDEAAVDRAAVKVTLGFGHRDPLTEAHAWAKLIEGSARQHVQFLDKAIAALHEAPGGGEIDASKSSRQR